MTSIRSGAVRPHAIAPHLTHSKLTNVGLYWSPGQGMRRPDGQSGHMWGLYLTANVHKGQHLQLDAVKISKSTKTVTITADARGTGPTQKGSEKQESYVRGGFSMKAEKWSVVVKDPAGHVLAKKSMMLGGPPAP